MNNRKSGVNMTLIETIKADNAEKWLKNHNGKSLYEAYLEVCRVMKPYIIEAERGAMANEIQKYRDDVIEKINNSKITIESRHDLETVFDELPILFLNNHGEDHIHRVIEKADEIISHFKDYSLTNFESFILLCSIQIHDIGNVLGRVDHEKKLCTIFDEHVKETLIDTPERRVIKAIAMAHGGRTQSGSKDTISEYLKESEPLFDEHIRPRELAAILRLADELADDSTRYSYGAISLKIIEDFSLIKHDYSRVLHTVMLEDKGFGCCNIKLAYELGVEDLEKKYSIFGEEKYLLDEIYDRTLKMERERRYCHKFLNANIKIDEIKVVISIYGDYCALIDEITYSLEDYSYPSEPTDNSIKSIKNVKTGSEELEYILSKKEVENAN
ncbi:MAG: hypothetical protein MJ123_11575 [Lachnospiraceae bacterium]|nr:hypothetical protein [Lachnospiraceae bacterium]